jgi:hypothetical protein
LIDASTLFLLYIINDLWCNSLNLPENMSFINKIEDVDIKSSEYFGFGQCLRSWVQSLTIKFFVYYRHIRKSTERFKKSPRKKKQL